MPFSSCKARPGSTLGGRSWLPVFERTGERVPRSEGSPIQVYGNTHGLKASQVRQIERLFRRRIAAEQMISNELARHLTAVSQDIRRQVGVLIDRRGSVQHVMVGDARSIELPDWGRLRAGRGRLRGLRCIHTHLADEGLTRDDLTDLALLRLDAIVSIAVREDGLPGLAHAAALRPANRDGDGSSDDGNGEDAQRNGTELLEPAHPGEFELDFQIWIRDLEEELARAGHTQEVGEGERAILVSVAAGRDHEEHEIHLAELRELARSAEVEVVDVITQNRKRVDPKTVVGQGKLQDLVIRAFQADVDLVIFDQDLSPTQARNLAERMELRVIDRTQLILDIFAQRATSADGKLQVELAQLKYRMPRLAQQSDLSLSRLAGGIGGRGPGEAKLEIDRRRVRDRVGRLERAQKRLGAQRANRRRQRARRGVPVLSIVGYTNAGKSTLLKALSNTEVGVADKMFATLDPVSRRLRFPREREVIVTDTVGFIRDLPADLTSAFRATLEELNEASALLHVVDVSAVDVERRIEAVREVLDEIGIGGTPELLVFNQVDRVPPRMGAVIAERLGGVAVSALQRTGLAELLGSVESLLFDEGLSEHTMRQLRGSSAH